MGRTTCHERIISWAVALVGITIIGTVAVAVSYEKSIAWSSTFALSPKLVVLVVPVAVAVAVE